MSELAEPFTEVEVQKAYLERDRERWKEYKTMDERADGMNPDAKRRREDAMSRLNYLLEGLWELIKPEVQVVEVNET